MNQEGYNKDTVLKIKKIISWAIFILVALWVGFFSYIYFHDKMIDYRMNVCLEEFHQTYLNTGLIYEYDSSCKEIFSDYAHSDYCFDVEDKDFCYYSFASFSKDESLKEAICANISSSDLCKNL